MAYAGGSVQHESVIRSAPGLQLVWTVCGHVSVPFPHLGRGSGCCCVWMLGRARGVHG
jgi:hypothetical protein